MKKVNFLFIFLLLFILSGCNNETFTINLIVDGVEYEVIENIKSDETYSLPELEKEGMLFIGWSDEDNLYYDDYIVTENIILTALFEDPEDVFLYEINNDVVNILGYVGEAKHLKIPAKILDKKVYSIREDAFKDSTLEVIEIPQSIDWLSVNSFSNSLNLREILFYGEYFGEYNISISNIDYDELMEEYEDICIKENVDGNSWTFPEGCPIIEVSSVTDPVEINGQTYFAYNVTVDLSIFDDIPNLTSIMSYTFSDLPSLTKVVLPERMQNFSPAIFYNTPNLTSVTFNDNPNFTVEDNIVYSADKTKLYYVPPALPIEEFVVSDTVEDIRNGSFIHNEHIKTLTIGSSVVMIRNAAFGNMKSLENIIVDEDNLYYYSEDNVLYDRNDTLIVYPMNKTDQSFAMPEHIRMVGVYAFYGQKHLETITLSPALERIEYLAFGKTQLTVLDLPSSVAVIDGRLATDSDIEVIIVRRSVVSDGQIMAIISGVNEEMPLFYVPDDSLTDYYNDRNWQTIAPFIKPYSEYDN